MMPSGPGHVCISQPTAGDAIGVLDRKMPCGSVRTLPSVANTLASKN